jgi:hypothetical protein
VHSYLEMGVAKTLQHAARIDEKMNLFWRLGYLNVTTAIY